MTEVFQLPPEVEEIHRAISQKGLAVLGGFVDGNGLKAAQVRLVQEETQIHRIPATIMVTLKPEIVKSQLAGQNPRGIVLGAEAEVIPHAAGLAQELLKGTNLKQEVLQAIGQTPEKGFGMLPLTLSVKSEKKEFSVISVCQSCRGATQQPCALCHSTGKMPCQTCRGEGYTPCRTCFGVEMVQDDSGHRVSCTYCQHTGRIICITCNGHQQLPCSVCGGRGSTPCTICGQTGSMTNIYLASYKALCQFDVDWRTVPADVRKIAEKLGIAQLVPKGHVDVYWQPPEVKGDQLLISCEAFLPISAAEFSVEGKPYPAVVAGLQGTIVQIDPLLDAAVKPGISALMKLSKGPLAVQALIDTACKYKMIRQVIAGLARYSKSKVYQTLVRDYPVVLSDKYARATISYAHRAVLSISAGPRYKGLVAGTVLAGLLAAGYYMTHLRTLILGQLEQNGFAQNIVLCDAVVWLLGATIAVFTIKLMTAAAFKKMLPSTVQMDKGGLPSAGMQGVAAFFTVAVACLGVAAMAAEKPEWLLHILKPLGH